MSTGIKIYKIKDFIRTTESGDIDVDRSIQIVRELAVAAAVHTDHNILMDLRETTLTVDTNMADVMEVAMEFGQLMSSFKNKIANVVPSDAERVSMAEKFEACMKIKKFQYRFFTDFEDAIEWLSDIKQTTT